MRSMKTAFIAALFFLAFSSGDADAGPIRRLLQSIFGGHHAAGCASQTATVETRSRTHATASNATTVNVRSKTGGCGPAGCAIAR